VPGWTTSTVLRCSQLPTIGELLCRLGTCRTWPSSAGGECGQIALQGLGCRAGRHAAGDTQYAQLAQPAPRGAAFARPSASRAGALSSRASIQDFMSAITASLP